MLVSCLALSRIDGQVVAAAVDADDLALVDLDARATNSDRDPAG
jgi:hypothetical protein